MHDIFFEKKKSGVKHATLTKIVSKVVVSQACKQSHISPSRWAFQWKIC